MKRKMQKFMALGLSSAMLLTLAGCGSSQTDTTANATTENTAVQTEEAKSANKEAAKAGTNAEKASDEEAFQKFDSPVTIKIGQQAYPTMSFPDGDTNEDNVYTRYLKDNFNIDVQVEWSAATGNDYTQKVNMCIASNMLPDGMQCDRKSMLAAAKAGELYDFTDLFPKVASAQVRAIMDSGDGSAYSYSLYNGRQVCTVGVDVATSGESMVNVRKDWLDEYGLEEPETLDDIENIARVFKEKKPAGNNTIPIAGPDKNNGVYSSFLNAGVANCGFEPVFAAYDAYPGYWVKQDDGTVVYGTNTENSRKAFERLANWYSEGLIDPEMGVRDNEDEQINAGNVGMYFCAWWKIGYGITDAYRNDPTANWQSYVVRSDDGKWNTREQCPVASYCIFNKDIDEDVAKAGLIINNVWVRDENKLTTQYGQNTSIYWYPLRNSMGALNECEYTYDALMQVLDGKKTAEDYNVGSDSPYKLIYNDCSTVTECVHDYVPGSEELSIENFDIENSNFPRLYSILAGVKPSATNQKDKSVYSVCYSQTPTMETKWANLETKEKEMGLRIITGKDDISAFDTYVNQWTSEGGNDITAEVQAMADAE